MSLPVSSQSPNDPVATFARTSSPVWPRNANSQSWMLPAPLVAKCVIQPSSASAAMTGARPFLIACAPKAMITGAPAFRAAAIFSAARVTASMREAFCRSAFSGEIITFWATS